MNAQKEKPKPWRIVLAWSLIILGISGIILPILPGWPFFFLGLFILAGDDEAREKMILRFPKKSQPIVRKYFDAIYENSNKKTKLSNRNRSHKERP